VTLFQDHYYNFSVSVELVTYWSSVSVSQSVSLSVCRGCRSQR